MIKIYSRKEYVDEKGLPVLRIRVIGLPIYTMKNSAGWKKHKYLLGLFKIRELDWRKEYYIIGLRIFKKEDKYKKIEILNNQVLRKLEENNKKIENKLISMHRECINKIQTAALAASQHSKIFPQFKNKHKGKDCVLVATGPTLNYYEPIKNAIHIGVNSAYKKESINLDYWFAIDFNPIKDYTHELKSIKSIKFFGQSYQTFPCNYYTSYFGHIPDSIIFSDNKSYKFYFDQCNFSSLNIDIETQLLPDLGSSIFQAAYFALYTGVKRIYLVGCDCSNKGHWNDTQQNRSNLLNILPLNWKKFKEFTEKFYPDVEIISINPIGLKGIFKEIYTKSFTENNTEIKSKI